MEDIKKLRAAVGRQNWGGHPVSSLRLHLIEVYGLIDWFFENTTNEYLGQNEKSVIKSIKNDNVPSAFKKVLLAKELSGKNRKNIMEALNG